MNDSFHFHSYRKGIMKLKLKIIYQKFDFGLLLNTLLFGHYIHTTGRLN